MKVPLPRLPSRDSCRSILDSGHSWCPKHVDLRVSGGCHARSSSSTVSALTLQFRACFAVHRVSEFVRLRMICTRIYMHEHRSRLCLRGVDPKTVRDGVEPQGRFKGLQQTHQEHSKRTTLQESPNTLGTRKRGLEPLVFRTSSAYQSRLSSRQSSGCQPRRPKAPYVSHFVLTSRHQTATTILRGWRRRCVLGRGESATSNVTNCKSPLVWPREANPSKGQKRRFPPACHFFSRRVAMQATKNTPNLGGEHDLHPEKPRNVHGA